MGKKPKFDDYSDDQESKFNMAIASLQRLHEDFVRCKIYSMNPLTWNEWYKNLRSAHREISCVLNKEELEKLQTSIKFLIKKRESYNVISSFKKIYPESFYENLDEFEIQLRFLANKHGLMFPSKQTILDFMEKMG